MIIYNQLYSNCLSGVILPFSAASMEGYIIILDENNRLWYAKSDLIVKNKNYDIEQFSLVFFRYDDNQNITSIYPFIRNYLCSTSPYPSDLRINQEEVFNVVDSYQIIKDFKSINAKSLSLHLEGEIVILDYLNDANEVVTTRGFFKDHKNRSYHELSNRFIAFIKHRCKITMADIKDFLLFDPTTITRIYDLVQNFNPYEVFESYTIQITYETVRAKRDYRNDHLYEYKSYSISYIDEYLEKWFEDNCCILRHVEGDIQSFSIKNTYKRFYDEERRAKERAYSEYSQQEHFDCLMKSYYKNIIEHIARTGSESFNYIGYEWMPESMNIRKAYFYLNSRFEMGKRYAFKPEIPELLTQAIKDYNKAIENQETVRNTGKTIDQINRENSFRNIYEQNKNRTHPIDDLLPF